MLNRGIIFVVASGMAFVGCAGGSDAASTEQTDQLSGTGTGATTVAGEGTTSASRSEPPETGLSAAQENGLAVPKVVGATPDAACRELEKSRYHGRVFSADGAGTRGSRQVVDQIPEPGSRGAAVDAPVYVGVPGPLPERLPSGTACPRRVIENLPANFRSVTDE